MYCENFSYNNFALLRKCNTPVSNMIYREADHFYIVVPKTRCQRYFQHHPGAVKTTERTQTSCHPGDMFDTNVCNCVPATEEMRSECEKASDGDVSGGAKAEELLQKVADQLAPIIDLL